MKLHYWLIIALASVVTACQNNQDTQKDQETVTASVTQQSCYTYIKNRDTASLTTLMSGHIVTGELTYKLFEKDSNKGSIKGEMRGDTLFADYQFNSEGRQSIREVAFLQKDGKLVEGYGEVVERDGKVMFKDHAGLKFGDGIAFTKINCN